MSRARLISPEFWTSEAVVDCAPMTRLLLLGLSNFADDFGVLALRPRTLRLQVFPGDALDDDAVRAMIEELAARGLVRRYAVGDVEYLSIVDWEITQRIGKRARRRHPAFPSPREGGGEMPGDGAADEGLPASPPIANDSKPSQGPSSADDAAWHKAVEGTLRRSWGADVPADVALHAARWRAQGHDLARDVLPAVIRVVRAAAECNRPLRLELVDRAMARQAAPAHAA
ncbi:MAG: hypothetical protein KF889_03810 [Alphaproteobacteria bacterium]|nr:hypothetical protein [Alphaproteobacteria bacterium]MCW5742037.1 hypothetical protein [Alphaproteobacteria bacterium]